jgi:hypothetical protein
VSQVPKCGAEMEPGFVVDHTYGMAEASEWVEGPVERSFWTGVNLRNRERRRVETARHVRCGFLESYAP